MSESDPDLAALRRLAAIAQSGLHYCKDPYDEERYSEVAAIARRLLGSWTGKSAADIEALLPTRRSPATPTLDVRAAVISDGRILLVRESDGRWSLPGGWAEVNTSPSENVEREVLEESGVRCRAVRVLAVWDRERHDHPPYAVHCYKIVFLCELLERGELSENPEPSEADFFAPDALPTLSTGRVTARQIRSLFENAASNAPAAFD